LKETAGKGKAGTAAIDTVTLLRNEEARLGDRIFQLDQYVAERQKRR